MTVIRSRDSLNCFEALTVGDKAYTYYSLKTAEAGLGDLSHLPVTMRLLLENLLRHEDGLYTTVEDMRLIASYHTITKNIPVIPFRPTRVFMHDEAAVSALVDFAALRDAVASLENDPAIVVPSIPLDIVIDHTAAPLAPHRERLELLRWAEKSLLGVRIVPPGKGIGNQLNLDFLTDVVTTQPMGTGNTPMAMPETILGTDRRFSLVNGLGVLGWQADVLDLEEIMLDQPVPLTLPRVLGVKITGKPRKGTGATDIGLAIARLLKQHEAAGCFVEFYGPGLDHLSVPDRAVIASLTGECGAVSALFPIDQATLEHMRATGRPAEQIALTDAYAKAQGLWRESWPHDAQREPAFTLNAELDLDTVRPTLSGPNSLCLSTPIPEAAASFGKEALSPHIQGDPLAPVHHGDVVLASITSCGNSAHPGEIITAALVARRARDKGLSVKPWVRTLLSAPSPVLADLLEASGLQADLDAFGFRLMGKDCAACLGCSTLSPAIEQAIQKERLIVCAVASGAREPQQSLHPLCEASFIASPGLVVAYAIAGSMGIDLTTKPLGVSKDGKPVLLKDLWPTAEDIQAIFETHPLEPLFARHREHLFQGPSEWTQLEIEQSSLFPWHDGSTFLKCPPIFQNLSLKARPFQDVFKARPLVVLGDDVAATQIAPDGPISATSPAGHFLAAHNVAPEALGTFGMRSGQYEVMTRGAFGNIGLSPLHPGSSLFDAAERLRRERIPFFIAGGKNYGHGPGQEWAAKATRLLGVSFVVAESYDPAHRLNLVRVGVLPLQIKAGVTLNDLKLDDKCIVNIAGIEDIDHPPAEVMATVEHSDGVERFMLLCRLDTNEEIEMFRHGSLLAGSLKGLISLAV